MPTNRSDVDARHTHVLTLAIDTYTAAGALIGTLLGARCVETYCDPHGVLDEVLGQLPSSYRQLTGDEVARLVADRRDSSSTTWEQLSIF